MRRILALATAGLALSLAVVAPPSWAAAPASDGWPQPRADSAHTGFNPGESILAAGDVTTLHRSWFKGPGTTDPLVEHGHVLACGSGSCYDRVLATGALTWKAGKRTHPWSTAIGDDRLWVIGGTGRVAGVNLSDGSPSIGFGQPGGLSIPATYDSGRVYASGMHGHVNAFPVAAGATGWTSAKLFALGYQGYPSGVTAGDQQVFASTCGGLVALRASDGRLRWYVPLPATKPLACGSVPALDGNTLVVVATSLVDAFDATTGSLLWSAPGDGDVLTAPALAYGRAYLTSPSAGTLAAYDLATGHREWSVPTVGASPPSVANGVVYVDGPGGLQAFDASTGALLVTVAGSFVSHEPVVAEGTVVLSCIDPTLGPGICAYVR